MISLPKATALLAAFTILTGCAHHGGITPSPAEFMAVAAGAAVAAGPAIAYGALDKTFAGGPAPRQAPSHPLSGGRIAGWTVENRIDDLAWRDDGKLSVLTDKALGVWTVAPQARLETDIPLAPRVAWQLDAADGGLAYALRSQGQVLWQAIDRPDIRVPPDMPTHCIDFQFADDGGKVACVDNMTIGLYPPDMSAPVWSFARSPQHPSPCAPTDPCRPLAIAAMADWIAHADLQPRGAADQVGGPIMLHSRAGETRTLTPVIKGAIRALRYSPSGRLLIVTANTQSLHPDIYVLDANDGTIRLIVRAAHWIANFRISRDDRFLCGPTGDSGLLLADLKSGKQEEFRTDRHYSFAGCAFSRDGSNLAIAVGVYPGPSLIAAYALNP